MADPTNDELHPAIASASSTDSSEELRKALERVTDVLRSFNAHHDLYHPACGRRDDLKRVGKEAIREGHVHGGHRNE